MMRVCSASVAIDPPMNGPMEQGIWLILGIEKTQSQRISEKWRHLVMNYRLFSDERDKMNLSLLDINGGLLVISQFTLAADTNKGLRPSFSSAAAPEQAESLYHYFLAQARAQHSKIESGIFAADMQVSLCNDGPVTFNVRV